MQKLVLDLLNHDDLIVHVAGWSITMFIAGGTILYKGIWKRINQIAAGQDVLEKDLNQLVGAHNAICMMCGNGMKAQVIERRADPNRETVDDYL